MNRSPWTLSGAGLLVPKARPFYPELELGERRELLALLGRLPRGAAGPIDSLERAFLDHYFGKATLTPPANLFLALSTTTPTEAGGNFTEPASGGYARVSTAPADWNAATGTAPALLTNGNAITFPTASGTWSSGSNMTHWGLFTAAGGGTVQIWGALDTPRPVLAGDTPTAAASGLRVYAGDPGDTYT